MLSATRRASYTSSSEQQRPVTASGMPSWPAQPPLVPQLHGEANDIVSLARQHGRDRGGSTPPDMATAMVFKAALTGILHLAYDSEFPAQKIEWSDIGRVQLLSANCFFVQGDSARSRSDRSGNQVQSQTRRSSAVF